ncbi:basic proline-rich protein-like [Ochotona curzoniae]|uniref:basic proline-rich protein-like n=1 Tax=Ochotona curzoniae TaxID=130825 RepID=UPI001B3538BE|nr:basic proline-rich protein-like [Ochotona curzoniae]
MAMTKTGIRAQRRHATSLRPTAAASPGEPSELPPLVAAPTLSNKTDFMPGREAKREEPRARGAPILTPPGRRRYRAAALGAAAGGGGPPGRMPEDSRSRPARQPLPAPPRSRPPPRRSARPGRAPQALSSGRRRLRPARLPVRPPPPPARALPPRARPPAPIEPRARPLMSSPARRRRPGGFKGPARRSLRTLRSGAAVDSSRGTQASAG